MPCSFGAKSDFLEGNLRKKLGKKKKTASFGLIISALVSCSSVCGSVRRTSCKAGLLNLTVTQPRPDLPGSLTHSLNAAVTASHRSHRSLFPRLQESLQRKRTPLPVSP